MISSALASLDADSIPESWKALLESSLKRERGKSKIALKTMELATQEQARLHWQGQLWPGQEMEWDVRREDEHQGAEAEAGVWHSRLRLRFPELGELDASLTLAGGVLQLRFATGSEDTAALLRRHAPELAAALDAVGTPLGGFDARPGAPDA